MSIFPTKILLATDGSDEASLAAQAATELSKETGSEVHLVYVLPTPAQMIGHHLYSDELRESLIGGAERDAETSSKSRLRRSLPKVERWRRPT
jgi:nucleotide-binding universal stress UspA family protein